MIACNYGFAGVGESPEPAQCFGHLLNGTALSQVACVDYDISIRNFGLSVVVSEMQTTLMPLYLRLRACRCCCRP